MRGGYTLSLRNGQEWGPRWSISGNPNPEVNPRAFLRAMVDTVVRENVQNWRTYFVLFETPRPVPADFRESDLERAIRAHSSRNPFANVQEEITNDNDDPPGGELFCMDIIGEQSVAETGGPRQQHPSQSSLVQPTRPSSSSSSLPQVVQQSVNPMSRAPGQPTILGFVQRISSSSGSAPGTSQVSASSRGASSQTARVDPSWARVELGEERRRQLAIVQAMPEQDAVRETDFTSDEREVMLEYVFQLQLHDPLPPHAPGSKAYWKKAIETHRLLKRKFQSVHNHWKTTASKEFDRYVLCRRAESPRRIG